MDINESNTLKNLRLHVETMARRVQADTNMIVAMSRQVSEGPYHDEYKAKLAKEADISAQVNVLIQAAVFLLRNHYPKE